MRNQQSGNQNRGRGRGYQNKNQQSGRQRPKYDYTDIWTPDGRADLEIIYEGQQEPMWVESKLQEASNAQRTYRFVSIRRGYFCDGRNESKGGAPKGAPIPTKGQYVSLPVGENDDFEVIVKLRNQLNAILSESGVE